MLQLYPSNKTEHLAVLIAEIMKSKPLSGVFSPEVVLIQSHGMGTWLQQEISSQLGIAAMINCRMPASFIWELAERLMPEEQFSPDFEKGTLRWEIYKRLPGLMEGENFQALQRYFEGLSQQNPNSGKQQALPVNSVSAPLLFQLSSVVSDIFDAYQNYRPDWISAWESSGLTLSDSPKNIAEVEAWQADLWRVLYPDKPIDQRKHRALVLDNLSKLLEYIEPEMQAQLPERIFVFGLSALPPLWLPIILKLSKYCEVHFLIHNPCQYYWGDILSDSQRLKLEHALVAKGVSSETAASSFLEQNPLLASWGQQGRDYLSILLQHDDIKECPVNLFGDLAAENCKALTCLQDDILNLQVLARPVAKNDSSIRFASCHSALRELEVLQDYLFALIDENPEINFKDIIVMMPDVQEFAALVDAVFSRPAYDDKGQAHYLAYSISDQLLSFDQPLLEILYGVLNLAGLRITATEVLDWLDIKAIRERFGVAESDLPQIHDWVEQLSIRWGISASHRNLHLASQDASSGNTWLSAFRRILAGYLHGEEAVLQDASGRILPHLVHSSETQVLAGKLMRFIDVIDMSISRFKGTYPVDHWLNAVSQVWSDWFDPNHLSEEILGLMEQSIKRVGQEVQHANFDSPVEFSVVIEAIKPHLQNERVGQRFLAGKINFCTLMPMRSIPFKVVCMLGMNEGHYPRPEVKSSFDLLNLSPARMGDRSRREDDRYLFLEAICSARSHLYISYCGYDAKDNSLRFPSLLVSELREYCGRYFYLEQSENENTEPDEHAQKLLEHWTHEHRLQAFHLEYYQNTKPIDGRLDGALPSTYSSDWLPLFVSKESQAEKQMGEAILSKLTQTEIELEQLISFSNNPLKYYYQNIHNLYFSEIETEHENTEPFDLSRFDEYQLKGELTSTWSEKVSSPDQVFERWQYEERMPRPPIDNLMFDALNESTHDLRKKIEQVGAYSSQQLSLEIGSKLISGNITLSAQGQVEISVSKNIANRFFGFWVKHVFWNVFRTNNSSHLNEFPGTSVLFSLNGECRLPQLDESQAESYASEIVELFLGFENNNGDSAESFAMMSKHLLPRTSYALLFETPSKLKSSFNGVRLGGKGAHAFISGEREDPYWRRACLLGFLKGQCQPDELPDLEANLLYQQVLKHVEEIEVQVN